MANQSSFTPTIPSPLEIMARIDDALAQSGLADTQVEREPLPLFDSLVDEWLICQGMDADHLAERDWTDVLEDLLRTMSACEIRETLRSIAEETRQLCRAHGSLSVWNQRELDKRLRTMLNDTAAAEQQLAKVFHP
ncbi:hypothetical protein [Bacterioplanoides sp.]|uniref:hypothetical protein n=1 Tax=Bacterioplanoides sp. TaxID=2066072 RepID=UPI003B00B985